MSGGGIDNFNAIVTANDNWWGADAFPGQPGTDTVATTGGSIATTTRLALALSPASTPIGTNASTTLTAKIVSTSAPTVAVSGTALEGLSLTFAPGSSLGSVSPPAVAIANGTAATTFSSGSSAGTTSPTLTLDNGTKSTSITIIGAPTANSQTVSVAHNTATGITLTGSDPNTPAKTLTFSVNSPSHGTLSGTAPNLTYTPTAGYQGADSFTFTVNNGSAISNTATVSLNVAASVPTANPQTVNVAFNTAKAITLTGTDADVPALVLTFVASSPAHGTLSGTAPNLTYTPNAGYHGPDSFIFTVNNGSNTSPAATVTLAVAAGTPTANAQSVNVASNTAKAITLTGTDPDVPPQALTYALVAGQGPSHGTLSGTAPNLTYMPNAGYSGPDSFQFTVNNGSNTSPAATVSLTVAQGVATVGGSVGIAWGSAGTASLLTDADGLRLLPAGRSTDLPWLDIDQITITLDKAGSLSPSDVSVTGLTVADYGPVTITGSGTSYTITLARPINAADRVTVTIGNANIATFTRRLDVLPGDFNDDGAVTLSDAIGIRNVYLGFFGAVPTLFGDINGDGIVDVNDYTSVRRLIGTYLQ